MKGLIMRHRGGSGARARLLVRGGVAVTGVLTAEAVRLTRDLMVLIQMARANSAMAAES